MRRKATYNEKHYSPEPMLNILTASPSDDTYEEQYSGLLSLSQGKKTRNKEVVNNIIIYHFPRLQNMSKDTKKRNLN
jgi:hypothetical protein